MTINRIWKPSPNKSQGSSGRRIIVLHTSEGATSNPNLANWLQNPDSNVSYHVSVDNGTPNTCYEYVRLPDSAWAVSSFNGVSVNGCFCTPSGASSGWTRQDWLNQGNALDSMAQWVKEEAAKLNIP